MAIIFPCPAPTHSWVDIPCLPFTLITFSVPSIPQRHVGDYAGSVESVAAFTICIGVFYAARLSDTYGRKPVTLFGVFGACMACMACGAARKYWQLLVLRSLVGFFGSAQAAWVLFAICSGQSEHARRAFSSVSLLTESRSLLPFRVTAPSRS